MLDADLQTCPSCGEPVTTLVGGLCPRCLIGNALGDPTDADGDTEGTLSDRDRGGMPDHPVAAGRDRPRFDVTPPAIGGTPAGPPAPADRSARLELSGEIGRGGMGIVLRARDTELRRELAVKVLRDDLRHSPEMVHRFLEEAQIAGQLQHPGIVPVHELGTLPDERPYFTMKLVKGRTLSQLLAEGRATDAGRARLLGIFEQVCQTVAYAHAHGVIHRDLKPSNVMVGAFGEVQVMDWGLAKVLRRGGAAGDTSAEPPAPATVIATARSLSDSDLSSAGSVLGTPSYMAPEQARGEVESIDERVDVFALGSILCEILSGQPAFTGPRAVDIQRRAADGDLSGAWQRLDGCGADAELVGLARDCLSAEREGRPRDAGVVAERLTGYLAGVQERLRAAEVARAAESARAEEATRTAEVARAQARAERRARQLTAVLAAAGVVLIALLGGGAAWLQRQDALRAATTTRLVDDALDRARQQEARARGDAADDPSHWEAALAEARRAEALLEQGRADAALRGRVSAALAALGRRRDEAAALAERLRVDKKLQTDLEAARYWRRPQRELEHFRGRALRPSGPWTEDSSTHSLIDDRYRDAFLTAGLDVDGTEPEAVGAWIASRSEPAELTAYFDGWTYIRRRLGPGPGRRDWRHLNAAARAADHDPWRDRLRAALDDQRTLEALADDEPGLEKQPVLSLIVLSIYVHDRQRAERVLRMAWRKQPSDFQINFQLADLMGENRTGSAEQMALRRQARLRYLAAAATARPSSVPAIVALGAALQDDRRFEEALDIYNRWIRLSPNADSYSHLANCLGLQKRFAEAADAYRTAIRLEPDNAFAHLAFAQSLKGQNRRQAAEAEYRESLRLVPDSAYSRFYFGWALEDWKRRDEAIVQFREAVRLDAARGFGSVGPALVNNLNVAGRYDEAIAAARDLISVKPDADGPYRLLVESLWRKGPPDAVGAEFRKGLPEPHLALACEVLGTFMAKRQRWDDAADALRQVVRLRPDSLEANRGLGELLAQKGEWVESLKYLNRAADLGRSDDFLELEVVALSLYSGDEAGCRRRCLVMLDHPDLKATGASLSRIRKTCKACLLGPRPFEPERASRLMEQAFAGAVAKNPGSANDMFSHLVLGMVEYRRGRFEQAVAHLEKCRGMGASAQSQADLMLAMSYHRLGRQAEARRLISASREALRKNASGPPYGGTGWSDWLTGALFLREAEALVGDEPARRAEGKGPGPSSTGVRSPGPPDSGNKPFRP